MTNVSNEAVCFEPAFTAAEDTQQYLIDAAIGCLSLPEFRERFVQLETLAEAAALSGLAASLYPRANGQARAAIRQRAADQLGVPVERAHRLGEEWHSVVQLMGETAVENLTLKRFLFTHHVVELDMDEVFQVHRQQAADGLEVAQQLATSRLDDLLLELDQRKNDPDFRQAANYWANTPNSRHETGEDGRGFNAGLIHFFEYRGDNAKRRRFRYIEEPMTVDGFITFSTKLHDELINCQYKPDNSVAILEDRTGNLRFYILLPDGKFIVGFQGAAEPEPKLTSIITEVTAKYFDGVVAGCLAGNDRGVLNKLGPVVRQLI